MAVIKGNSRYQVKVVYRTSYDTSGTLSLPDWSQTFSYVDEQATTAALHNYAVQLAGLTVYREAPYKVQLVDTAELIAE